MGVFSLAASALFQIAIEQVGLAAVALELQGGMRDAVRTAGDHINLTLKDFLQRVARIAEVRGPLFEIPYGVAWMAGAFCEVISNVTGKEPLVPLDGVRMAHAPMYYDSQKAVKELGLPQSPIHTAIEKAVRWFKDHGYAKN